MVQRLTHRLSMWRVIEPGSDKTSIKDSQRKLSKARLSNSPRDQRGDIVCTAAANRRTLCTDCNHILLPLGKPQVEAYQNTLPKAPATIATTATSTLPFEANVPLFICSQLLHLLLLCLSRQSLNVLSSTMQHGQTL